MTSASLKGFEEVNSRLPQAGESQLQTFHWSSLSIKTHNVKLTASGDQDHQVHSHCTNRHHCINLSNCLPDPTAPNTYAVTTSGPARHGGATFLLTVLAGLDSGQAHCSHVTNRWCDLSVFLQERAGETSLLTPPPTPSWPILTSDKLAFDWESKSGFHLKCASKSGFPACPYS